MSRLRFQVLGLSFHEEDFPEDLRAIACDLYFGFSSLGGTVSPNTEI